MERRKKRRKGYVSMKKKKKLEEEEKRGIKENRRKIDREEGGRANVRGR